MRASEISPNCQIQIACAKMKNIQRAFLVHGKIFWLNKQNPTQKFILLLKM